MLRVGYDAPRSQAMTEQTAPAARPRAYTDEFRRAAVGLLVTERLTVSEAARRLGVHTEVLR